MYLSNDGSANRFFVENRDHLYVKILEANNGLDNYHMRQAQTPLALEVKNWIELKHALDVQRSRTSYVYANNNIFNWLNSYLNNLQSFPRNDVVFYVFE